jgi:aryl-alcohol dehydrogenase-like predicted oxidoreductase
MGELERRKFLLGTGLAGAGAALLAACQRRGGRLVEGGAAPSEAARSPAHANSPIPQRPFGSTGEEVSALGLGGYHLGIPEESEALRIMHRAIDEGVTFFDNCWSYHEGESERRMGKALLGGKRQRVFLMTKIDARTRGAAAKQIDGCLQRLRTDRVDLMQLHEVGREEDAPWVFSDEGAIRALEDARRAGKIRYVGFTGHKSPAVHLRMVREAEQHGDRFDAVQMPLNLADAHYESFQRDVLPVLTAQGTAIIGMKALASGDLLKSGVATAEECLRFALSLPASTVVTGCDSEEILEQAPLDGKEQRELLARAEAAGQRGQYERFKTTKEFDSLERNPRWMTEPEL